MNESETVEYKKSLGELKEGLISIASFDIPSFSESSEQAIQETIDKAIEKLSIRNCSVSEAGNREDGR